MPQGIYERPSVQERFRSKWAADPETGCHIWTACINHSGYGSFRIEHRNIGAHRAAWELARGPIPAGMHILHRCDRRSCVNPEHMSLGTNADNVADMVSKGRQRTPVGEAHGKTKLNDDAVDVIRSCNLPDATLARALGCSPRTVHDIRSGRRRTQRTQRADDDPEVW